MRLTYRTAGVALSILIVLPQIYGESLPESLTKSQQSAIDTLRCLGADIRYERGNKPVDAATFLNYLDAKGSQCITDEHLVLLAELPKLDHVDLSNTSVTNEGLACLKHVPSLSYLNLGYLPITNDGLGHLSHLTRIHELYLDGTDVTNACVEQLAPLQTLTILSLSETSVDSKAAKEIQLRLPGLVNNNVTSLSLFVDHGVSIARVKERAPWIKFVQFYGGHTVDDNDLQQISDIPQLEYLRVDESIVTDAGLSALRGLTCLKSLHLCETNVRGPGLRNLQCLKTLKELHVSAGVDESEIKLLQSMLPDCKIEVHPRLDGLLK